MIKIIYIVSFFVGLFSVAPIVTLNIDSYSVSYFTIFFIAQIFLLFLFGSKRSYKYFPGKITRIYFLWFLLALVSSFFGLIYFVDYKDFFFTVISYVPKIVLYLIFILLVSRSQYKESVSCYFFKGLFIGCIVNICWAILEGIIFYRTGTSLTASVFSGFLERLPENRQFFSIIREGGIRVSGLNYDPAHLGGIVPILFLFSVFRKNGYLLILSLIALLFSQSTTGLMVIIASSAESVGSSLKNSPRT